MRKKICAILIAVLVAVLGTSTYFIIDHYKEANKQAELYDELADLVDTAAQTNAATEPAEQIPYSEEKMLLPELAELYQQNGDLVGWISIADTNINYPVMQSVNEPNFYLKHGFDKAYSDYGCPYVQEDCDVQEPSDNLVIYGHHMSNGSMFAHLEKFKDKGFWNEHRTITFNTLTDKQEYEIVAVFRTVVYTDSPDAFKYYRFVDAESTDAFDDFMQVTHLVPLVGGECDLLFRTTLTAAGICDKGLHLEVLRCHQCTGHTVQVNTFIALIDMVGFRFAGYGRGRVKPCLHTQSCFQ